MLAASALSGWLCPTTSSAAVTRSETSHTADVPNSSTRAASTAPMMRRPARLRGRGRAQPLDALGPGGARPGRCGLLRGRSGGGRRGDTAAGRGRA